jgi:hypothetical protein
LLDGSVKVIGIERSFLWRARKSINGVGSRLSLEVRLYNDRA